MSRGNDRAKALLLKKAELRAEQEALTPFDTGGAPLFRARLLRLGADDHVLLLIMHHVIVDGWSIGILMEEVSDLYAAFAAGRRAQLPEPSLRFSDVACWQHRWCSSGAATRQVGLWRDHLRGASSIFPANGDAGRALLASSTASEPVHVSHDLTARLGALSRDEGASLFMTLLTGFKALLLARSGREDLCIATAMANRSHPQTERVIGPLVNTTLIRTWITADMSFQQALARVRRSVLEAHARQDMPFDSLAERLADDEGLDPESLIQVFFVLQNASRPLRLPGVTVQSFVEPDGEGILPIDRTWLSLTLKETTSGLSGSCNYKSELFKTDAVRRWMADYRTILVKAAADPKLSLGRLADD
jgi:non-ribosomal peptide synthetase component F